MPTIISGDGTITGLTATGISAVQQLPAGSVLQVVQATYGTQVSNSSASPVDTNLTATITPKFSTSKILVIVNQNGNSSYTANVGITFTLLRGASVITIFATYYNVATTADTQDAATSYLDSPATTSATTYKTQMVKSQNSGTVYTQIDSKNTSTITLMEIAA
jgi:hypothetical protein